MFLSSTDQSPSNNPSSSSSFLHLTNSSDELGQSHLSTFSIRDYAFSYRTKNIKKNWPFSSTSLQLCLKHGLSDPLPPFHQPLGSVISPPPEVKKPNITHVEAISYKRKSEKLGCNQTLVETKQSFENGLLASASKSKIQVAMVNKNPRKKFGLIVKPGACVDSGSKEDHSCLFSASESMALRTCPICKTFSSASNTTLNAHIDQCLSVDLGKQPTSKPNRPRTKPRLKVKTMVDIYASAKEGTLEDLDKRNGTKWAMISSYSNRVVSDNEVANKGKKRTVLRVHIDEDAAGIGPVYIDAKGQKLRILSEFSEKASEPSREHADGSEKKSSSEGKGNKSFRKKLLGKKYYKYPKLVRQSKKLTVRKGNALEKPEYHRRGYSEGARGFARSETSGPDQSRIFNQRMLTKGRLSRHGNKKRTEICDQPSENGHSLSEDPLLVVRGSSHVSPDMSETVSSPLNSQGSWRVCGESQVSGKSWALSRKKSIESDSFVANPLRCSIPVDKEFSYKAKGVMKFKKARLDFSETEDEDTGKWESEMTQERELTDYDDWDDNGETDKLVLSSNPSFSREDNDYESYEETGNNKGDDDMLDKTDDADAEFESMIYEKNGGETTAEQESSFMEVDPIPIPGPPGSFLPSPWDMGTDVIENHGNSSVITSQVQSSQDLTDRNSSESPVSPISNFAAPETQTSSLHNIITTDKRPSRFRDSDQSCCCQRKERALEDTTFCQPQPHMIQQDYRPVPAIPSNPNPVLRLMGKDLMVINQREEEPSHYESSPKPTSQFQDLSKTQQVSPSVNLLHPPHSGSGLYFNTSTSYYNIP